MNDQEALMEMLPQGTQLTRTECVSGEIVTRHYIVGPTRLRPSGRRLCVEILNQDGTRATSVDGSAPVDETGYVVEWEQ